MNCMLIRNWRETCRSFSAMNPILIPNCNCQNVKTSVRLVAIVAGAVLLFVAGATTSCSTARGFGQDVEKTGDKIQNASSR